MSRVNFEKLRKAAERIQSAKDTYMCHAIRAAHGGDRGSMDRPTREEYLIFRMHCTDPTSRRASSVWVLFEDTVRMRAREERMIREQLLLEIELNMKAQGYA